jgi:DNA-binding XRE family transcriptional regulator
VCIHEKRDEIDREIVSRQPYRALARTFGVSKDSISRHANLHIPETLTTANAIAEVVRADMLLDRVEVLVSEAEGLLTYGKDERQAKAWEGGLRELRKCLELLARVTGELDERPQVNLAVFPEWVTVRTRLLAAVESHPEARGWLVDALDGAPD